MKYLVLFLLLFLFIASPINAAEKGQVMIINQVRGEECCDKGSISNLEQQLNAIKRYTFPSTFALRYDVLKDPKYIELLKKEQNQQISLGILLEITPNLARDSGVTSHNQGAWNEAQNVYSIGYTKEENTRLLDTIFETFKQDFGYYPEITSSWMIQTDALNYIHEKYGVKIHQTTREQYALDSYTLYGGLPHYPYPASASWAFVPDYTRGNAPIIVRQTVTDPLQVYGDTTSSYTSQPNDYLINKDFSYFKDLIHQALLKQEGTGFALLGLETSMHEKYQKEFAKQLELLKEYDQKGQISFPTNDELVSFWNKNHITLYQGDDLTNDSKNKDFIISTPSYRIRLRQKENSLFISDIRVYNPLFSDPYYVTPAVKEGYWIMPFLLDGSLKKISRNPLFSIFQTPQAVNHFLTVSQDTIYPQSSLELPNMKNNSSLTIKQNSDELLVEYINVNKQPISLHFREKDITTSGILADGFVYNEPNLPDYPVHFSSTKNGFSFFSESNGKKWLQMNSVCNDDACTITFDSDANQLANARSENYAYLFPEQANHPLDQKKTVLNVHNSHAIAKRNPVRMVLIPYDKYGIITSLSEKNISISAPDGITHKIIKEGKRYFIDFLSDQPTRANVTLSLSDGVTKKASIYFAPNCKTEKLTCLTHPFYGAWYVDTILGDKLRQLIYNEKQ